MTTGNLANVCYSTANAIDALTQGTPHLGIDEVLLGASVLTGNPYVFGGVLVVCSFANLGGSNLLRDWADSIEN